MQKIQQGNQGVPVKPKNAVIQTTIPLSVVIPLYNKQHEILRALNSVFNQTVPPDQVIVVDDGSTDHSAKLVVNAFGDSVCLYKQENNGVSAARNYGIQMARNEYVCMLDADDEWLPGHAEEIISLIHSWPEAVFYSTRVFYQDEYGNNISSSIGVPTYFKGCINDFPFIFSKGYGLVSSSSVCLRKSFHTAPELAFPVGEKKGEDLYYWLNLGMKGSLAFSAVPLVKIYLDAQNRSKVIKGQLPAHIKWFFSNKDLINNHRLKRSIKRFIYENSIVTAYNLAFEHDRKTVNLIIKLYLKDYNFRFLLLLPALFLPSGVLNVIRKIRRSIRSYLIIK